MDRHYMPFTTTLPYETRPDKKPLSSESFFAVRVNCGTRDNKKLARQTADQSRGDH
jgi:hypothetical protein